MTTLKIPAVSRFRGSSGRVRIAGSRTGLARAAERHPSGCSDRGLRCRAAMASSFALQEPRYKNLGRWFHFCRWRANSGDHFWRCDTFLKYRLQLADFQKFHWFPSYDILTCVGSVNGGEAW